MLPPGPLSSNGTPSWSSRSLTRRVIAGCDRWSWPAARITPPSWAIDTKVCSSCRFIGEAISKADGRMRHYALANSTQQDNDGFVLGARTRNFELRREAMERSVQSYRRLGVALLAATTITSLGIKAADSQGGQPASPST